MLYPPEFCSEHVAGNCLLFCSKCVPCDSAFPPACAICCYCLSVSVCGRKPAGTEDLSKKSKESPVKSDQDDNCWWTTGSRRLGPGLRHLEGVALLAVSCQSQEWLALIYFGALWGLYNPNVKFIVNKHRKDYQSRLPNFALPNSHCPSRTFFNLVQKSPYCHIYLIKTRQTRRPR